MARLGELEEVAGHVEAGEAVLAPGAAEEGGAAGGSRGGGEFPDLDVGRREERVVRGPRHDGEGDAALGEEGLEPGARVVGGEDPVLVGDEADRAGDGPERGGERVGERLEREELREDALRGEDDVRLGGRVAAPGEGRRLDHVRDAVGDRVPPREPLRAVEVGRDHPARPERRARDARARRARAELEDPEPAHVAARPDAPLQVPREDVGRGPDRAARPESLRLAPRPLLQRQDAPARELQDVPLGPAVPLPPLQRRDRLLHAARRATRLRRPPPRLALLQHRDHRRPLHPSASARARRPTGDPTPPTAPPEARAPRPGTPAADR
mmetsp:Transcript_3328/g.10321  ORF Transcript_3328/g.10321 Transcript_3328/m.10321 type:complete len:326 (+) Transcript_3328:691-1668(+)